MIQGVLEWNHWEWSNIEKWINSKPNDEKKQALLLLMPVTAKLKLKTMRQHCVQY
jgi:hypothetical protein